MSSAKFVFGVLLVYLSLNVAASRIGSLTTRTVSATPASLMASHYITLAPGEPRRAARQLQDDFDVCAVVSGQSLRCSDAVCSTSLARQTGYVGCCEEAASCTIYTTCYDGNASGTSTASDELAMTCSGASASCYSLHWDGGSRVAFACTDESLNTSSSTSRQPTHSTRSRPDSTGAAEPTVGSDGTVHDLTQSQRIGIGVGCGVFGVMFISTASYCICFSRRRRRRRLEAVRAGEVVGGKQFPPTPTWPGSEKSKVPSPWRSATG